MHSKRRDVLWNLEVMTLTLLSLVASSLLTDPVLKLPFQSTAILEENSRYFRTLVLDVKSESLYVGAAENIYRINLKSLGEIPVRSAELKTDKDVEKICKQLVGDKLDGQCRNHISVIIPRDDGSIIACGNGARSIQTNHYTLDTKTLQVSNNTKQYGGLKCDVPSLEGNSSVALVDQGNPWDYPALYLATDKIIRPALKDEGGNAKLDQIQTHMDSKWLNNPSFVGSYLEKDHVYFWFREVKYRLSSFTADIFSRVARICVNDKGGSQRSILKGLWTSYFKGTLNCSIPGGHPYYFTELQDIVKINDTIHAIFTTPLTGPYGSAVCTFSQSEIDKMFLSGKFMDAENHYELYQPTGDPKPGQKCANDSFVWTDSNTGDLKKYMDSVLMHDAVQHDYKKPAYYEANAVFRKLAVETFQKRPDLRVYYIATTQGQIHKVVTWTNDKGSIESHLLMVFQPNEQLFIWDMKLYGDNLFLATESKVIYQPTRQCDSYMDCFSCSRDPHCGWNPYALVAKLCQPYDGSAALIQNVGTDDFSTCNATQLHHKTIQLPGEMIHLPCVGRFGVTGPVQWIKDGQAVKIDFKKRFITKEDGLVINDGQEEDKGFYTCQVNNEIKLITYDVTINNGGCIKGTANEKLMCAYIGGFRKWCQEFDSYQTMMNHWQNIARNCSKCTDNDKIDNAHCSAARSKTSR
ncbi:semaphorin-2A-like [Lineus longissimus]|uniref:semaphorin-2A-like n=1 Tax=Lineus longissimus TaxID=88925 RepID=UPI002B4E86D9